MIFLGVAIGVILIIFAIMVITLLNTKLPEVPLGKYQLIMVTKWTPSGEETIIDEFAEAYYIEIKEKTFLESHSGDYGIKPNEKGYSYLLGDDEMMIFDNDNDESFYKAYYIAGMNTIKVFYEVDGADNFFYYVKL